MATKREVIIPVASIMNLLVTWTEGVVSEVGNTSASNDCTTDMVVVIIISTGIAKSGINLINVPMLPTEATTSRGLPQYDIRLIFRYNSKHRDSTFEVGVSVSMKAPAKRIVVSLS